MASLECCSVPPGSNTSWFKHAGSKIMEESRNSVNQKIIHTLKSTEKVNPLAKKDSDFQKKL